MDCISYKKKKECCGCLACVERCPKNAIEVINDEEGFAYPNVNEKRCINCGICNETCMFYTHQNSNNMFSLGHVYAAKNCTEQVRKNSASGGIFSYISDLILEEKGVIYGCILSERKEAVHIRASNKEERNRMRGSKYVQSNTKGIYRCVENDLKNGKKVLFSGTPCQIGGLRGYLKKDYPNLYLCDIICHGVSSPLIYKEFVKVIENTYHSKIECFEFRDKSKGWLNQFWTVTLKNGRKKSNTKLLLMFKKLFYQHYIIRPSCHDCVYTNMNRLSDITIGDYWGIKDYAPSMYDSLGVSVVILNSEKGKELFLRHSDCLDIKYVTDQSYLQPQLRKPTSPAKDREHFWTDYDQRGFIYAMKEYANLDVKTKLKLLIPTKVKDKLAKR